MTLEEAIKHCEEVAEANEKESKLWEGGVTEAFKQKEQKLCECAKEHRQLAEWLEELKERREIQDILLQFFVDSELDICCDELAEDEEEWEICGKNCNNKTKECWIRWAKMKAREVKR